MNFLDINETIPTTGPTPTDEELQTAINRVHELGGIVIVNHIPWSNTTGKKLRDFCSKLNELFFRGRISTSSIT
jgi:hypothetical protein